MKRSKSKRTKVVEAPESSDELLDLEYVDAKRKQRKLNSKKSMSANDMFDQEHQRGEVLDIHRGDQFIATHIRPSFLKRWDGESNTLELSANELDEMSPLFRVYWQHKSRNMNCVIFVQVGRVQFLAFENDAIKLHEIFNNKKLKKYSKFLMVNFWSKEVELAKMELFQRRIPVLMLNEIDDPKYKQENNLIRREITEVITPSIFLGIEPHTFKQRVMLAVYVHADKCGIACIDIETNHFYLQYFEEGQQDNLHQVRRILNRYHPVELLVSRKDHQIKKMGKQICNPYIVECDNSNNQLNQKIKEMKQLSNDRLFKQIMALYLNEKFSQSLDFSQYSIVMVLDMTLNYFKNLSLETKIFGQAIFEVAKLSVLKTRPMFDSQVYENLEVFSLKDEEDSFGAPGTLYHYVNYCITNSGYKMLKKWMDEPLRTVSQISERQMAIQNLVEDNGQMLISQKDLIRFETLERKVGNVYHWAVSKSEEGHLLLTKDLKFDKDYDQRKNPAVLRIKQIYQILNSFEEAEKYLSKISSESLYSEYLKKCCKIVDVGDAYRMGAEELDQLLGLPQISNLCQILKNYVHYDAENNIYEPQQGLNQIFDNEKQEIDRINQRLQSILEEWREKLKVPKISYVSVRARNEIQVPLQQGNKIRSKELIFSSQTSTHIRFVSPQTAQLSNELIEHEENLAKAYEPFLTYLVKQFCAQKHIWDRYITALSRIDVLMSLAKASCKMTTKCMPLFVDSGISIVNGYNPVLLQVMDHQQVSVIPNTLKIDRQQRVLLLTGPNMGGKSTLLKQTCLLAILAQIGCYVPAEKYQSIVFDQMFCRIGASDRPVQGKSTFYVELQETKRIVDQATPDSLVIIDELGRGTSTYDGLAIAEAILSYLLDNVGCYILFSTHYYSITKAYLESERVLCSRIGHTFDNNCIRFTYQLQPGVAEKSFASEVAKRVGISQSTLEIAESKTMEIELVDKFQEVMVLNTNELLEQILRFINQR